jgi:hypothetical protein
MSVNVKDLFHPVKLSYHPQDVIFLGLDLGSIDQLPCFPCNVRLGVLGHKTRPAMGFLRDYRVQGVNELEIVLSLPRLRFGIQSKMGQSRILGIIDTTLALVGDQDGLLVQPGCEGMHQPIAADISPTDWLAYDVSVVIDGGGDAHLVLAQAPFAIMGTPVVGVIPESIFPIIGNNI